MQLLVVSDFHLGKGQFLKNGQANILEDFLEDERFIELLEYYSSGKYYLGNVHLVLNGDILNLIQIDIEGVLSHIVDEPWTVKALDKIIKGHKELFEALKNFLSKPNKEITYIIGNHDAGMAFEGAQQRFREAVGEKVKFGFELRVGGVLIEHGHRFEVANASAEYYREGPNGRKILNLPWGSLFCISLFPQLKKERPFIDKVRPLPAYIKWCLFHDPLYFIRIMKLILKYFVVTNFATYTKQNSNFKTNMKILKHITIYPKYAKNARKIFKDDPSINTIVMGHSHLVEWRRFPENKLYFNTGTWNVIPSIDLGLHENATKLTYVAIDIHNKTQVVRNASLKTWHGQWRPFRDEVSMTGV